MLGFAIPLLTHICRRNHSQYIENQSLKSKSRKPYGKAGLVSALPHWPHLTNSTSHNYST